MRRRTLLDLIDAATGAAHEENINDDDIEVAFDVGTGQNVLDCVVATREAFYTLTRGGGGNVIRQPRVIVIRIGASA